MREATALEVAVGLLHLPSRVRTLRASDLPPDLEILLRIVADDDQALADALRSTGKSKRTAQAAASFYIEQVLLHPDADSYRALGVNPDATTDQLRRHMALMVRWLHPDRDASGARAIFVSRVTEAWNNLKTVERRAVYDAARRSSINGGSPKAPARPGAANSAESPTRNASDRHRRPIEASTMHRRPMPASVWRFLRQLMRHGR